MLIFIQWVDSIENLMGIILIVSSFFVIPTY